MSIKTRNRDEAIHRYGPIDLASAYWPNQSKWIQMFEVPKGWFPAWHVLNTNHVVEHIACNTDIHGPLLQSLTDIHKQGFGDVLKTFDGCLNIRRVRGSNSMSTHAYGLSLDLNASLNPLGSLSGDFIRHMEVVNIFKKNDFTWGGDFHNRKDQMHFQYADW